MLFTYFNFKETSDMFSPVSFQPSRRKTHVGTWKGKHKLKFYGEKEVLVIGWLFERQGNLVLKQLVYSSYPYEN